MSATVGISPTAILQFFDNRGEVNAGGSILTQVGMVNYPTYQDAVGNTPLPNPIPLNSRGEISNASGVSCELFLVSGVVYTFTLYDAAGNQLNQAPSVQALISASTLAGSSGSSLVGFIQSGTGAVAITVQDMLRNWYTPEQFGAVGNGTADDSIALQAVGYAIGAAGSGNLYLVNDYYIPATTVLDWSAASNMTVTGPGRIIGPSVANQAQASAGIKQWGTVGSPVAYGSTITAGQTAFTVSNSFAAGDYLLLSNFPTDATDAYTNGTADLFGRVPRIYANTSSSNLRQTRRKERVQVETATGSAFTIFGGTVNAYTSTVSLQFEKITDVTNVRWDAELRNINLDLTYCRGVDVTGRLMSSILDCITCESVTVEPLEFDANGTDSRVDFYEASRLCATNGVYKNLHTPADNGIVKFTGCTDCSFDVVVEGCDGTFGHGVQIDENFGENYTGYSDLPANNISGNVVGRNVNGLALFVTCDPFAALVSNCNITGSYMGTAAQPGVLLKGCDYVNVAMTLPNNTIDFYGARHCDISSSIYDDIYYAGTVINPRGGQVQTNSDNRGAWFPFPVGIAIAGSNTPGTNTYSSQASFYRRDGDNVKLRWEIVMTNKDGTMNGNVRLVNLPYTCKNVSGNYSGVRLGYWNNWTLTANYTDLGGFIAPNNNYIEIQINGSGQASTAATAGMVASTSELIGDIEFQVDTP